MNRTDFQDYLKKDIHCSCGKIHRCEIDTILIESNALQKIAGILNENGYHRPCIVEDIHTRDAAGEKVEHLLIEAGYAPQVICFEDDFLIPDEMALAKVITEMDRNTDLILAVGSGSLNDLCKFISYKMKLDYMIIATAPSMDGYASNVAPLITNHAKVTYEAAMPKAIVGDLFILKEAPMNMIAAGVGDVLGKYVCLMDWKLSNLITEEYICHDVMELVDTAIEKVMQGTGKLLSRDPDAIASIMEGLILSGIGMSYIGNSRPASGSEHHLSHYWEMMALLKGGHIELHGTKVAIGTICGLSLYEKLAKDLADPSYREKWSSEVTELDMVKWEREIKRVYLDAAGSVIDLESKSHKNDATEIKKRKATLLVNQETLLTWIEQLPESEKIADVLKMLSAKYLPAQAGVDRQDFIDSILYAKDLRNRFGILQAITDLGMAKRYAEELAAEFYDL